VAQPKLLGDYGRALLRALAALVVAAPKSGEDAHMTDERVGRTQSRGADLQRTSSIRSNRSYRSERSVSRAPSLKRVASYGLLAAAAMATPGAQAAPTAKGKSRIADDMSKALSLAELVGDAQMIDYFKAEYQHFTGEHAGHMTPRSVASDVSSFVMETSGGTPYVPEPVAPAPSPASVVQQNKPPPVPPKAAPNVQPRGQTPFVPPANPFAGIAPSQNAVNINYHGTAPTTVSFWANAGPYQPNFNQAFHTVRLQPGQSTAVQLPQGWSGRVQKMTGTAADPATWGELTFDGWQDLTWSDVSAIRGANCRMVITDDAGADLGQMKRDPIAGAPAAALVKDSGGTTVVAATEPFTGGVDDASNNWLHSIFSDSELYMRNFENAATHCSKSHHVNVDIW
jgi:hypothetical protein